MTRPTDRDGDHAENREPATVPDEADHRAVTDQDADGRQSSASPGAGAGPGAGGGQPPTGPDTGGRRPPGGSIFSLEGRAAPGLYLLGWLGTLMGAAILLGSIAAGEAGLAGLFLITASLVLLSVGLVAAAGAQALERRARAVRPYVGPSPFLVFAASLVVTILLLILVGRPAVALGFDLESSGGTLISISITALVYVGLVRLLVVGMGALSWSEMGLRPLQLSRVGADILYGASFAVPTVFVTGLLGAVLVQTLGVSPEPVLPQPHDQATLLLNLVSAAVIAPVGEELFFRGFATTAWIRSFGATRAIVQGAIFFAFIHILTVTGTGFGDAAAKAFIVFVVRLPVSVGLGLVFAQRRSIYASIGMHGAFNGILVLVTGIALAGLKG